MLALLLGVVPTLSNRVHAHFECFFPCREASVEPVTVINLDLGGEQGCSDCCGVSWIHKLIQSQVR